jgi:hypothetical protein
VAASDREDWVPAGFVERIGAALVAPVRALRAADSPENPGRAGTDAALLIAIAFVTMHAPELVAAGWMGYVEGAGVGLSAVVNALSAAVAADLVLLFIAAVVLTLAAGRQRSLGRDFDLACVAILPFVTVELVAGLVLAASGVDLAGFAASAIAAVAYGWTAAVLLLAWRQARARSPAAAATGGAS